MGKSKYIINNYRAQKRKKKLYEKFEGYYEGDIHFTKGPLSIFQFNQFAEHGLLAVRLFHYIRTKQGLVYSDLEFKGKDTSHLPIYLDNKNLYEWSGLHQPDKWKLLKKLKKKKLIDYKKRGSGKLPIVRIICDKKKLN